MLEKSIILLTGLVLLITLKDVLIYETKQHNSDSNEASGSKVLDSSNEQSEYKSSHHSDDAHDYESSHSAAKDETDSYSSHKNQNDFDDEPAARKESAQETVQNEKKIPSLKLKSNIQTLKFKFW
jgi:hypothetical protein